LAHETLENYYKTNFQLIQNHSYSLHEIESMIPWEREIYLAMLVNQLEEQQEIRRQMKNARQ
jgi:hypothetical protein